MIITSKTGMGKISGVSLKAGRHKYPSIDPKDPLTAIQLQALLDIDAIEFDDTLPAERVKEAEDALNEGRMVIKSKKRLVKKVKKMKAGKKESVTKEVEYLGSEIVPKKDAGKPAKKSKKSRKDTDSN